MLDRVITDFQQRKLQIDFVELKLVQNRGDNPISFNGKGYLLQSDDDSLDFKLYATQTENTNFNDSLNDLWQVKTGTLYDVNDYYILTGIALDGFAWIAKNILPNSNWLRT